jgi:hypothetical protein
MKTLVLATKKTRMDDAHIINELIRSGKIIEGRTSPLFSSWIVVSKVQNTAKGEMIGLAPTGVWVYIYAYRISK